jgi:hypothetical protein
VKIEVAAVQLERPPMLVGPRQVMRALARELEWQERPRAGVETSPGSPLQDVLEEGARRLGLRVRQSPGWDSFPLSSVQWRLCFDGGDGPGRVVELEAMLDDYGAALWWFNPLQVTVADAFTAREAGLLDGDPLRAFAVVDEPTAAGGNGLDVWLEVIRGLSEAQRIVVAAGAVAGPWLVLKDSIRAAIWALNKARSAFDRGGDLRRFSRLFRFPRTTQQAAALLGVGEEHIPDLLRFLGLERSRDGYWRPSNQPDRKQLAELGSVVDTAAHMHLRAVSLREGLADVLALPPGERAKQAEGIFRRHEFDAVERHPEQADPYVARAENGRDDQFEVLKLDKGGQVVLGTIQAEADGGYSVIDPAGRRVVDDRGSDMRFLGIDQAAAFISSGYRTR